MFTERYRAAYVSLGLPLLPKHGISPEMLELDSLEGLRLPQALLEYYLIAGDEPILNQSFNRLLAPEQIGLEAGRIVFMEENQQVVYWGVPASSQSDDPNPIVEQGIYVENEPLEWHSEHSTVADFLETALYWQASFGGLKYQVSAAVTPETETQLRSDFRFVGAIGGLKAFARDGCALCLLDWFDDETRIFAGFAKKKLQVAVGRELGVLWEET